MEIDDKLDIYFDCPEYKTWAMARLHHSVLRQIQDSPLWQLEEIPDIPLTEEQMIVLVHGYQQDYYVRYGLCYLGGYFYVTRSGYWLKKLKFSLGPDGYYHLKEHYTTEKEKGRNPFRAILIEGDFSPEVYDDRLQQLFVQQDQDKRERNLR